MNKDTIECKHIGTSGRHSKVCTGAMPEKLYFHGTLYKGLTSTRAEMNSAKWVPV